MGVILSVREVEMDDAAGAITVAWRVANADGRGYGDVLRAVALVGRAGNHHPALAVYPTREAAVAAAEALGRELAERVGGAYEILPPRNPAAVALGSRTSPAKASAARRNGRRGGRPRTPRE